jgi:predicted DNA-binding transcriptional regulator AlpA
VAISPALFDVWIEQGKMPKGRKVGGVVLWDTQEIWTAWCAIRDDAREEPRVNPFDGVTA